jgi:hypothetical protein
MMNIRFVVALSLVVSGLSSVLHAGLINTIPTSGNVVTLQVGLNPSTRTLPSTNIFPGQSIDVMLSSDFDNVFFGRTSFWGMGSNGTWTSGGPNGVAYDAHESEEIGGMMTFDLSTPVGGFAFFMSHAVGGEGGSSAGFDLRAYRTDDTLVDAWEMGEHAGVVKPIGEGDNYGEYRGITSAYDDITKITLFGDYPVFSSFTYSTQSVNVIPEPSTFSMLAFCGLAMAGYSRLRRRRK